MMMMMMMKYFLGTPDQPLHILHNMAMYTHI